ncbi:MAG: DUF3419 family protein [Planctomycetota bacterium]|jgi:S-adenosylmethionine-diacylglycerol 3-amino-3-carboxypropyl transferase|nr:DUF3419 family protein [Planctomycetota bacterium]
MKSSRNPLQFAVVREDPDISCEVIRRFSCRRALVIASGGCTALSLVSAFPDMEVSILDANPAQLQHVKNKIQALGELKGEALLRAFNVEEGGSQGLSECGNFEALFRGLRRFLYDLVLPYEGFRELFEVPGKLHEVNERVLSHPYWPVAFEMYFCDSLLVTMFGAEATQYAESGSYPGYFRRLFERGFLMKGAADNPFLHHVFLGHYLERAGCLPRFLESLSVGHSMEMISGDLGGLSDPGQFDFLDLSNIFDWMDPGSVRKQIERLTEYLRPGAVVLYRQLNNDRDLTSFFGDQFEFDVEFGRSLHTRDRSLFYSSIHVGQKVRENI